MIETTDEILRDWLLGRLAAPAAEMLEARLLDDEAFAEHLRAVENDLLDDYAREKLTGAEHERAAAYFAATPRDRVRLRIARALATTVDAASHMNANRGRGHSSVAEKPATNRSQRRRRLFMRGALASVCAVLIALVGVRLWSSRLQTPEAAPMTITLTGDQQRGAANASIAIPTAVSRVRMQVEVGANASASRYTLRVDDDAGANVFSADDLEPRVAGPYRFVEATLPATALAGGRHRVRVAAKDAPESESSWFVTTHAGSARKE